MHARAAIEGAIRRMGLPASTRTRRQIPIAPSAAITTSALAAVSSPELCATPALSQRRIVALPLGAGRCRTNPNKSGSTTFSIVGLLPTRSSRSKNYSKAVVHAAKLIGITRFGYVQ